MRDETKKKVLDFPEPTQVKQIQRFIELVNYFRDHVHANHDAALGVLVSKQG